LYPGGATSGYSVVTTSYDGSASFDDFGSFQVTQDKTNTGRRPPGTLRSSILPGEGGGGSASIPRLGVSLPRMQINASQLHTRGTKIPGGRKVSDTVQGSNTIRNSSFEAFKRVDFHPSRPHNGKSPHTHPNFRNELPDGSVRSGVSRQGIDVRKIDLVDAARPGGIRTGAPQ